MAGSLSSSNKAAVPNGSACPPTERERSTVRKSTLEKYNIKFDEKTNKYISE
jgi:hypothetical protein